MNQLELLEEIKLNDGVELALDKVKQMSFSLCLIRKSLEEGGTNKHFSKPEEVSKMNHDINKWKKMQ